MKILTVLLFLIPEIYLSAEKADLLKECTSPSVCRQRDWFITDQFHEEFIHLKELRTDWKRIERFPAQVKDIFPERKSSSFSLMTRFDASDEFLQSRRLNGIYLKGIGEVYSIYINGVKIAEEGKAENGKTVKSRYGEAFYPVFSGLLKEKENILFIHLQGNPGLHLTGLYRTQGYYLDDYFQITYDARDRVGLILIFLYLFTGFYHLFLYYKRRNEIYNLMFGLFAIASFIYMFSRSGVPFEYGLDSILVYRAELMSVAMIGPLLGAFLDWLLLGRLTLFFRHYFKVCTVFFVLFSFLPPEYLQYILKVWQVCALTAMGFYFHTILLSIRNRSSNARRLFFGLAVLILCTVFDVLDSMIFKTGINLNRFAFFAFVIGIAGVLANRFLNLHEMIEDLNKNLEHKVQKRTEELQESLTEVRLLKEQQDGDYFLTTLIVSPLATNTVHTERIHIDVIMKQKKKFMFKGREHEIGGDICISDQIVLKGKKYAVFINGDAMGKSIQGAGGALVLGVVFKSIISRTVLFAGNQNVYPERWLKLSFIELQKIFESFDGSMMISVVMGMIDTETGFMYFLNAEHPWTAVYRDEKASFIESSLKLRKIGMPGISEKSRVEIQTFQLYNGDSIFIGSDGRDDLNMGTDEAGRRLINEDENLFLRTVEESSGDLEKIYRMTEEKGEVTDDFSIMRIRCFGIREKSSPAEREEMIKAVQLYNAEQYDESFAVLQNSSLFNERNYHKLCANIQYRRKNFREASEHYIRFLETNPEESSYLFAAAKSLKLSGDLEAAADFGERLRLRDVNNIPNLYNLAEIYRMTGNLKRAESVLSEILMISPEEEKAKDLLSRLDLAFNESEYSF
ncbi:MAG TPA: SpoIIE family protein phosphatase [Leptospiraceae bacterium]|nr:SpoIIE family protein phosphatase [Leptospiraceae bacterium]